MIGKKDNRRKYVRLNTVFPIEFQLVDNQKHPISPLLQGFTRDVGKGGMCIETKIEKDKKNTFNLIPDQTKLRVVIDIPSSAVATQSYVIVRWCEKVKEYILDTYKFGVEYDIIDSDNQRMIERHVTWLHKKPKIVITFILVLLALLALLFYVGLSS